MTDADLHWDSTKQEVTVTVRENQIIFEENLKTPVISGEGQAPLYAVALTATYSGIQNLGDGYFLGIDDTEGYYKYAYDILDSNGKVKSHFSTRGNLQDGIFGRRDVLYIHREMGTGIRYG